MIQRAAWGTGDHPSEHRDVTTEIGCWIEDRKQINRLVTQKIIGDPDPVKGHKKRLRVFYSIVESVDVDEGKRLQLPLLSQETSESDTDASKEHLRSVRCAALAHYHLMLAGLRFTMNLDEDLSEESERKAQQIIDQIRGELTNLAPDLFSTATAMSFIAPTVSPRDPKERIVDLSDRLLMTTAHKWEVYGGLSLPRNFKP